MNNSLVNHIKSILVLKNELTEICKLEYHNEIMKIWARWIITHRSLFSQSSLCLPSDEVYDVQLIKELMDKGCPEVHAKYLHNWLIRSTRVINKNYQCTSEVEYGGIHGNVPVDKNYTDKYVFMQCCDINVKLTRNSYRRMKENFESNTKLKSYADSYIWLTGVLYSMLDGKGLQWAVPSKLLDYFKQTLKCNTELFASPINAYYDHYYSLFHSDYVFGSSGNFFTAPESDFKSGTYQVNPPFIDSLFTKTTTKLLKLLAIAEQNGEKLTFIYIMPEWSDFPTYYMVMDSPYCIKNIELRADNHYYYQYSTNNYIRAKFNTLIIFLSTDPKVSEKVNNKEIMAYFNRFNR